MSSKGGHSHRGGDDFEPRPMKSMINFDGKIIDAYTVSKIENDDELYDEDSETGTSFAFTVVAGWDRFVFKYKTQELRDTKVKKFKTKLLALGCVIV